MSLLRTEVEGHFSGRVWCFRPLTRRLIILNTFLLKSLDLLKVKPRLLLHFCDTCTQCTPSRQKEGACATRRGTVPLAGYGA